MHYPDMDIKQVIARNIAAWMAASAATDTLKKLAARSGVSFGTVQRARNGEVNLTVENLAALAAALGKSAADLVTPPAEQIPVSSPLSHYLLPSSNIIHEDKVAESGGSYGWPFKLVSKDAYDALPPEAQGYVQGCLKQAIDHATEQFGTATRKRTA